MARAEGTRYHKGAEWAPSGALGGRQPRLPATPPGTFREVPSDLLDLLVMLGLQQVLCLPG